MTIKTFSESSESDAMKKAINECADLYKKHDKINSMQYELIAWKNGVNKHSLIAEFNIRMLKNG